MTKERSVCEQSGVWRWWLTICSLAFWEKSMKLTYNLSPDMTGLKRLYSDRFTQNYVHVYILLVCWVFLYLTSKFIIVLNRYKLIPMGNCDLCFKIKIKDLFIMSVLWSLVESYRVKWEAILGTVVCEFSCKSQIFPQEELNRIFTFCFRPKPEKKQPRFVLKHIQI